MPGTVLGCGDVTVNKTKHNKISAPMELTFCQMRQRVNKISKIYMVDGVTVKENKVRRAIENVVEGMGGQVLNKDL